MKIIPRGVVILLAVTLLLSSTPSEVRAYLGPGGAISGIGALLALIAALIAALLGFVWYPMKRLIRWFRSGSQKPGQQDVPSSDRDSP